jgi:hypothetical protein
VWENKLADLDEILNNLNVAQRKWVYLEPYQEQMKFKKPAQTGVNRRQIFSNLSVSFFLFFSVRLFKVQKQISLVFLPYKIFSISSSPFYLSYVHFFSYTFNGFNDQFFSKGFDYREVFRKIDDDFRMIMTDAQRDNRIVALLRIGSIKSTLTTMLDRLERCQKSLNEFLEEKRSSFPRFYFIGDDDLLQILGQAMKPAIIQTHLKKLFAGIYNVNFDSTNQV